MLRIKLNFKGGVTVEDRVDGETIRSVTFNAGSSESDLNPNFTDDIPPVEEWPDWLRERVVEFHDAFGQALRPWSRPKPPPPPPHTLGASFEEMDTARIYDCEDPSLHFDFSTTCDYHAVKTVDVPSETEWTQCVPDWLASRRAECLDVLTEYFFLENVVSPWPGPRFRPAFTAPTTTAPEPAKEAMPASRTLGVSFEGRGTFRVYDVNDRSRHFDFHYGISDGAGIEVPSEAEWTECVPDWLAPHRAECLEMFMGEYLRPVWVLSPWSRRRSR